MADLGKIKVTQGGTYNVNTTYEELTNILYNGSTYTTLKTVKGITPVNDGVNYQLAAQGQSTGIATTTQIGVTKPDGETISVTADGTISAKIATVNTPGIVKPADTDFTIDVNGIQKVNTSFSEAAALANIIAGEAIATIWAKVAKSVSATLNLDQNALLKSMLTSQQVNDTSKVPTSALVYAMQQAITANETAVTKLNSDLGLKFPYWNDGKFSDPLENIKTVYSSLEPGVTVGQVYNHNVACAAIVFKQDSVWGGVLLFGASNQTQLVYHYLFNGVWT